MEFRLWILDPANVIPTDSVRDGREGFDTLDGAYDITTTVIGTQTLALVTSLDDHGVQIMNITDPANVTPVYSIKDGENGFDVLKDARDITVVVIDSKTFALVTSAGDDGVQIISVVEPRHYTLEISESIGILDSVNTKADRVLFLSDSLGIADSVQVTKIEAVLEPKYYELELSDSVVFSDSVDVRKISFMPEPKLHSLELSDSLIISDSVDIIKIAKPKVFEISLTDVLSISDDVTISKIDSPPPPRL